MPAKSIVISLMGLSLLCGSCQGQSSSEAEPVDLANQTVTILGTLTGNGEEKLMAAIAPFTAETGIEVVYEGTDAFTTLISVRVDAGNAPDIALFPQPGLMLDFAHQGALVPQSRDLLAEGYADDWLELASVEDAVYGVWMRADVKSLVWYNPEAFAAAGYTVPTTWADLEALMAEMVAANHTPWCLGMESGVATGWVGTDWLEEILLRQAGPDLYDQWVTHDIPFNHPQVQQALETFGAITRNPDLVRGGPTGVVSIPFGDAPAPLFTDPPGCYLHRQASFISDFLPAGLEPGATVDVFPLPPMTPATGNPVLVGGIVFAQFQDRPAARALMEYLATAEAHTLWANEGYISPHRGVSLDAYPDGLTRHQAAILHNADLIRFDGSDLMPGEVGTGTFWTGMVDYVGGADAGKVLTTIDASWPDSAL
jgi:alpha-glucoside transport system substrate-binding protein